MKKIMVVMLCLSLFGVLKAKNIVVETFDSNTGWEKVLAENALKDVCGLTNPRRANLEDIMSIFKAAF